MRVRNLNRDPPQNQENIMLSRTNTRRLANDKLSLLAAHLICLHIILLMCCST
jgi:hypothetical protein